MDTYIQKLKNYIFEKQIHDAHVDADSILDMLYFAYMEDNPISEEPIKENFQHVDHILSQLSIENNDSLFLIIVKLCEDYAKSAFLSGIHIGVRLFLELSPNG